MTEKCGECGRKITRNDEGYYCPSCGDYFCPGCPSGEKALSDENPGCPLCNMSLEQLFFQ